MRTVVVSWSLSGTVFRNMAHMMTTPDQGSAIDKALDILFHLHAQQEVLGVSDIGRSLSIPKSTAHRCLAALRRRDLVEQDEAGRYRPGFGVLQLAEGLLDRDLLVAAAEPVLQRQAAELGETCFLVAARAGRLLVLGKAEGTGLLRLSPAIGSEVPVSATAVGKLYLAHAPHLVAPSEPTRYTDHTIIDPDWLARDVEASRSRGFAVNDEEWIEGLGVVAAPIFLGGGMAGAVCVAMSRQRHRELGADDLGCRVIEAATRVGWRMGGGRR
jgi:IclR family acetate operon transcriptional repressor